MVMGLCLETPLTTPNRRGGEVPRILDLPGVLTIPGLWARVADTPTLKLPLGKCWQLPLPGACRLGCHSPLKGSLFLTLLGTVA